MYTNFRKLSNKGDKGERLFVDFLQTKGYTNIQHVDDTSDNKSDYDIKAVNPNGDTLTFEVKNQDVCHKYGTFNVEQIQYGKPGGIAVTKADYFVFVNPVLGFGFIKTSTLKSIHYSIQKKASMSDYRSKNLVEGYKLWITKFENYACGWRMDNNEITWYKM